MGIKDLTSFLNLKAPNAIQKKHLSDICDKEKMKIAIDTSLFMYKFKYSSGENFLSKFLEQINRLAINNITPIYVFDGVPPSQKMKTIQQRKEKRDSYNQKIKDLNEQLDINCENINNPNCENLETLKKIYAERYFLDKKKNEDVIVNTIDLDGFITKKEKTFIVEIKEKTPIKPKNIESMSNKQFWSYGWDTRRILWYSEVQKKTGFEIFYIVRQIENRKDRKFVQWDCISLNDYLKGISWSNSTGGGGGGDTLTVPYNHFLSLQKFLDKTYLL